MDAKEAIGIIHNALKDVRDKGQTAIPIEGLQTYLKELDKNIENKENIDLKLAEYAHERNIAHYQAQQEVNLEMLRSVVSFGQTALKATILINGGAAAALLAFIGNIWAEGLAPKIATNLTNGILFFCIGVFTAALGTVLSYLTQYFYSEKKNRLGIGFHILTVIAVLSAFGLFLAGSYEAYLGFRGQFKL